MTGELIASATAFVVSLVGALLAAALAANEAKSSQEAKDGDELIFTCRRQAIRHANAHFWFGMLVGSAGFAWVLYSGLKIAHGFASLLPGGLLLALAVVVISQASRIRQQGIDLYERLQADSRARELWQDACLIDTTAIRDAVRAQLILRGAGQKVEPVRTEELSWWGAGGATSGVPAPKHPGEMTTHMAERGTTCHSETP